ncbi:hypothetical protein [uncultured Rikenella sp.]|uniref:hypothetical protein n=1 Tax=uncultured Rikenella sp. TaxID=368003 RepID=UPI00261CB695|nr:hypothetical protein [uncultured Rikenella sp.]
MKTALYVLLGTATLLIFVVLGVEWWIGSKIRRTVEKEIADRTDGAVKLRIGRVRVSLHKRTVLLRDIAVGVDTSKVGVFLSGADSVGVEIGKIALRGIRFSRKGEKYISLRSLEIDKPRITLVVDGRQPEADPAGRLLGLRDKILAQVGRISAGEVRLCDAEIRMSNGTRNSYAVQGLTLEADGFLYNPARMPDARPLFCDDVRLTVSKLSARFPITAQMLEAEHVELGLSDRTLSMANIRLIPQYDKAEYAWKVARHTDWTQAIVGSVIAQGVDYNRMWHERSLAVDTLTVKDAEVASYKNRRIVRQEQFKPMLHEMIQGLPFAVEIGTAEIVNARAVYEELSASGDRPGRITFDGLNGVFRGITNRPETTDTFYTLTASGKVMDTALLRAVFRFPAHPANDRFEVEGTLGPVNLQVFNRMLTPLAEADIRSGRLDGLSFSVAGNHKEAEVTMKMRYSDLSVALLREGSGGRKRERRLLSGLVNFMFVKSSNPDHKGLRTVRAQAVRDTAKSPFNFLWKVIAGGIKSSTGFPGAK